MFEASEGMLSVAAWAVVVEGLNATCSVQFEPELTVQFEQKSWSGTMVKSPLPVTLAWPMVSGAPPVSETVKVLYIVWLVGTVPNASEVLERTRMLAGVTSLVLNETVFGLDGEFEARLRVALSAPELLAVTLTSMLQLAPLASVPVQLLLVIV